jgi:hypothetical protein
MSILTNNSTNVYEAKLGALPKGKLIFIGYFLLCISLSQFMFWYNIRTLMENWQLKNGQIWITWYITEAIVIIPLVFLFKILNHKVIFLAASLTITGTMLYFSSLDLMASPHAVKWFVGICGGVGNACVIFKPFMDIRKYYGPKKKNYVMIGLYCAVKMSLELGGRMFGWVVFKTRDVKSNTPSMMTLRLFTILMGIFGIAGSLIVFMFGMTPQLKAEKDIRQKKREKLAVKKKVKHKDDDPDMSFNTYQQVSQTI